MDLPLGKKPIDNRWVYRTKFHVDGSVAKYKARLVVKGYEQSKGIDYEETFAPVAKWTTLCLIVALASYFGWKIHQMDVKYTFLNCSMEEEVYMIQPQGFVVKDHKDKVCKLKKPLYGLKQAQYGH